MVYMAILLDENSNFGCYKFVMYNLHNGIILPYTI
jgi:preprotein translocase subunit Sec63